ncbi:uncharacterized protein LOC144438702 [Glandiceps talaboti]
MEPKKFLILCVYFAAVNVVCTVIADPLVNTTSGTLQGTTVSFEGVSVDIYKGVRYAEAPIGERRFSKPTPYASREGIYDATEFGPSCPQSMVGFPDGFLPNTDISEDCLMLNIYVPETATDDNKLAVIVWIHGGGFTSGQGMLYNGTPMTVYGDVIVVTINYRLGILAMMSTGDEHAKGNYGMFDQQLALRWVKENIGHFNGEADRITISGQSAGGSSVLYHTLSPSSDGLFARAIVQSAMLFEPVQLSKVRTSLQRLASFMSCPLSTEDSRVILECLRTAPVESFIQAAFYLGSAQYPLDNMFGFTIDGEFFQASLSSLIAHSDIQDKYDMVVGTVDQDGIVLLSYISGDPTQGISEETFEKFANRVAATFNANRDLISDAIIQKYTDWQHRDDNMRRLSKTVEALGDHGFYTPVVDFAKRISQRENDRSLFYYNFAPTVVFPIVPSLTETAGHGDELLYLWSALNQTGVYPPRDVKLSKAMMTYWSNFAKTGDPNNGGRTDDMVTWPQFTNEEQQYLELTYDLTVKSHPKAAAYSFWKEYLVDIGAPENSCPAAIAPPIQPTDTPITMETKPSVETTYGKVTGFTVKSHDALGGKNVDVFLGIPYAKPPTGSRRFRAPQTTDSWTELNVTQYAPACPQPDRPITSEDCLYLNIFTPSRDNNNLLPVMVIIHGDRFTNGDSSDYAGDVIAAYGDVVVVTLNYRLGILGFLSTENDTLPGNYAFHDILFALEWIRGDVINFGGNPDQVTLAGFKAGAVAVQFLMTSPLSRDLFHRVICLSGSSLSPLVENRNNDPLQRAERFIKHVGCVRDTAKQMIRCLQRVDVELMINMIVMYGDNFPHRPVVDGDILVHDPTELMTTGDFDPLDMIVGSTSSEQVMTILSDGNVTPSKYNDKVESLVASYFHGNANLIALAIHRQYPSAVKEDEDDDITLGSQLLDMTNDFSIYAPIVKTAKMHSSAGGQVYMYHFTQRLSQSLLPPWVGPAQGDDLKLLLGDPFMTSQDVVMSFNNQERQLSLDIMSYVTNFVKTGNPNTGYDVPTKWSVYTLDESNYLELDICPGMKTRLREEQVSFWNSYMIEVDEMTTSSTDSDEIVYIGDSLGMRMTANQAETLIKSLAGLIIAFLIALIVVIVAFCGYTQSVFARKRLYKRAISENGLYNGAYYINEDTHSTKL